MRVRPQAHFVYRGGARCRAQAEPTGRTLRQHCRSCLLHPINSSRPRSKNGENYHFMYCRPAGVGHWAEQSSKCQECTHLTTSTYLSGWEPSVPRQRERGGAVQRPPYPAREVGRRGARIGSQRDSKHSEETQTQTVLFKRTPIAVCPRGVTRIFPPREADSAQAFFARADK